MHWCCVDIWWSNFTIFANFKEFCYSSYNIINLQVLVEWHNLKKKFKDLKSIIPFFRLDAVAASFVGFEVDSDQARERRSLPRAPAGSECRKPTAWSSTTAAGGDRRTTWPWSSWGSSSSFSSRTFPGSFSACTRWWWSSKRWNARRPAKSRSLSGLWWSGTSVIFCWSSTAQEIVSSTACSAQNSGFKRWNTQGKWLKHFRLFLPITHFSNFQHTWITELVL